MIGETLGSFRIVSQLGHGGMGVIYQAEHQMIGKRAAIKVLRPELSRDREVIGRFFNEAKAVTAIDHPGLVDVYDFGYTPDGSAYIVMELLAGESLGHRLARERALPIDPAVALVRQLCGVLAAAHARDIVHRDLKPDNIYLTPDPDVAFGVRAKVLDFGIAKLAPGLGGLGTPETQTGMLLGTPLYMSPEQCRGAGRVDHRADIYSLGVIFFEMICGRTPFTGIGMGEVIAKHQYEPAPAPHLLAPGVPPRVDALISRMLAKPPEARPQTMTDVLALLDGATPPIASATYETPAYAPTITPQGVSSTAPHAAPPITVPRTRRRGLYAGAAIAVVGAVAAGAVALRGGRTPDTKAAVLALLPDDTAFVMTLDATRLVQTPLWRAEGPAIIAAIARGDRDHTAEQLRTRCALDPTRDLHWFAYAFAAGATTPNEGAFLVDGAWDRDQLDHCFALLAPELTARPQPADLAGSPIHEYGDTYIAWVTPHTAAFAVKRQGVPFLRRLVANVAASHPAPLQAQTAQLDRDAVAWLAGAAPGGFPPDTFPFGMLDHATTATISIALGDELDGHLAVVTTPAHAAEVEHKLVEALAQAHAQAPLVDQIHVAVHDDTLAIDVHLDAAKLAELGALIDTALGHVP